MTDQPKCATCRFYDSGMDECRRRAPIMLADDTQAVAMWPTTVATEWCGEHEAVPAPAPRKVFCVMGKPLADATDQELQEAWDDGTWSGHASVDLFIALMEEIRRRNLLGVRPSE